MSIRIRFLSIIGILSLIAALCLGFISYRFSVNNAMQEAKNTGSIIFNFIEASRMYFRDHQRPLVMELVEEDRFFPEIMSGFTLTRGVWDKFTQKVPDYQFKQATVDPLFPSNKADDQELKIIANFRNNPKIKTSEGIIEKNGLSYFYFARPIMMKKGCLRCHGDPADAPKDQIEIYGSENGYNWKVKDTVASFIVYVPIQKALDEAKKSASILFLTGMVGFIILMLVIWVCLNKFVINSVKMLEERTTDISLGKNMETVIETSTDDEIGSLARAIDRLRISMIKMLERCQNL
jgi:hypothetical protein